MEFESIFNLFVNNGLAIGITAYFLFRDYKFNEQMITTLTALKEAVEDLQRK